MQLSNSSHFISFQEIGLAFKLLAFGFVHLVINIVLNFVNSYVIDELALSQKNLDRLQEFHIIDIFFCVPIKQILPNIFA